MSRMGCEASATTSLHRRQMNGTPFLVQDGKLIRHALETSGVDMAEEMTKVIESQRAYSYALRMVQTSDEIVNTVNSLRQ